MSADPQFDQVLEAFLCPNNQTRKQAEAYIEGLKAQPDVLVFSLLKAVRSAPSEAQRGLAAVLLRKMSARKTTALGATEATKVDPVLMQTSAAIQTAVRSELLLSIEQDTAKNVRRKVADTISVVASAFLAAGQWPELLPKVVEWSNPSSSNEMRHAAMSILSKLAEFAPQPLQADPAAFQGVVAIGLADTQLSVRVEAVKAVIAYVIASEGAKASQFAPIMPQMLSVVEAALNTGDDEAAEQVLEALVDAAGAAPKLLCTKEMFGPITQAMMQIGAKPDVEIPVRSLAVNLVVSMAEHGKSKVRDPAFVQGAIQLVFSALLEVEDDEAWLTQTEDDEVDGGEDMFYVGLDAIGALAGFIGGKAFLPPCFSTVQQLWQSGDWKHRHAALMAVSQIGDACKKQLVAQIGGVLGRVLPFFTDPHPRVVFAALQLVGVFCDDLAPDFQTENVGAVLPAVLTGLSSAQLRIRGQAAAVLVNFCEGSEDGVLDAHLDQVLAALVPALQVEWRPLQEDAVTALQHVATHSKAEFAKYYASFMPGLKAIIANATTKESRTLRGKAIECMSLIGAAVSLGGHVALFEADGAELMQLVLGTLGTAMEADDPMKEYLLLAIPRVAQALKGAFVPYLPQVLPLFLKSLENADPQALFSIQDEDDVDEADGQQGMASQVLGIRGVGKKRINVHVEALTEMRMAAEIVCNLAANLEVHFFPYVAQTSAVMLRLMDFPLEEIRQSVMKILPELMRAGVQFHEQQGAPQRAQFASETLRGMLPVVLTALCKENDTENVSMLLENFAETVQLADSGALVAKEADAIVQILRSLFDDCKTRQNEIIAGAADGDADEKDQEDVEEELEVELELQSQIGECLGAVVRSSKQATVAPFDKYMKDVLGSMMAPTARTEDRMMALCAFIDIVEHGAPDPTALGYAAHAAPAMTAYAQDKDGDLRQAAAYGLGIVAQAAPEQFAPHAVEAVKCLSALLSGPAAQEKDNLAITDNAVNSLGRIALACPGAIDAAAITQGWLQRLPLQTDRVEAKNAIILLDKMIVAQFAPLFADPPAATAQILRILVDGTTITEEGTQWASALTPKQAIGSTLQHLQATVPADVLQGAFATLPQEAQAALQAATA